MGHHEDVSVATTLASTLGRGSHTGHLSFAGDGPAASPCGPGPWFEFLPDVEDVDAGYLFVIEEVVETSSGSFRR
jgi:hypothetical protein